MRNLVKAFFVLCCLVITGPAFSQNASPPPLGEGEIWVNGRIYTSLQQAFQQVGVAGIIRIGPGVYKQGGVLKGKHRVHISGTDDTIFDGVAVGGKGAFVIASNDVTIENIACRNIKVKDKNGACVRFEGTNLTLRNVHFSDSENGILAGPKSGKILIEDSVFEGNGKDGYAHAMYINGGELTIRRTKILNSVSQGHEVKTRAERTTIENSIIASLNGRDSRLIDAPNGGIVIVRNSLLVEGPASVNWQLFSFGVEGSRYENNAFKLERNVIVTDREAGSVLILVEDGMPKPVAVNNIVVGKFTGYDWPINNFFYESRAELNWPEAPTLPEWDLTAK
ncbi:MAG: right-handed parallel beta-helix repeat-containing protein [Kordiimonas sp.]